VQLDKGEEEASELTQEARAGMGRGENEIAIVFLATKFEFPVCEL